MFTGAPFHVLRLLLVAQFSNFIALLGLDYDIGASSHTGNCQAAEGEVSADLSLKFEAQHGIFVARGQLDVTRDHLVLIFPALFFLHFPCQLLW